MSLSIKDLLEDKAYGLDLQLIAGEEGLTNRLYSSRIQKPGLALTGYTEHLHPDRVQVSAIRRSPTCGRSPRR